MQFIIDGRKKLEGEISVAGMKNAITPIIAATLLTKEPCVIDNVPRISDVDAMLAILQSMGSNAKWTGEHQVTIHNEHIDVTTLNQKLMKHMRSSILLLGPLLASHEEFMMAEPGGCIIGNRPLDTHFQGLQALGAVITPSENQYRITRQELKATTIIFLESSVTATENVIMAATGAHGVTTLKNAACEPHIQDLCHVLVAMGAKIEGIGTTTLQIQGGIPLSGMNYTVIPDQIEAGTFIIMGIATHSRITVNNVRPDHMDVVLATLQKMGAKLEIGDTYVKIESSVSLSAHRINAQLYPGIPTDLQALFGVLATQTNGPSLIHDTLYEGRMGYIGELTKMGANAVICDPHRVLVTGPTPLYGQEIRSFDLRAGAALIVAGLLADGTTIINQAETIDRGYEKIDERLRSLGASIQRVE
ncbi:MAG: UDP-N-acetylglucosamine 1-carboxyvinyltransferase [bacterium]|nr:UDP-N-acetylglucosamine 1-carboxyvinyltransferase [bacterium]